MKDGLEPIVILPRYSALLGSSPFLIPLFDTTGFPTVRPRIRRDRPSGPATRKRKKGRASKARRPRRRRKKG